MEVLQAKTALVSSKSRAGLVAHPQQQQRWRDSKNIRKSQRQRSELKPCPYVPVTLARSSNDGGL